MSIYATNVYSTSFEYDGLKIEAEYLERSKRLTVRVNQKGIFAIDWYDWTDDFLDDAKFQRLVIGEIVLQREAGVGK